LNKPVIIAPLAQGEIESAASFYEGRREGLGAEFTDRVAEALHSIELAPEGFQKVYKGLRRCGLRQFTNWALWFRVLPDNSVVIACLSGRRDFRVVRERALGVRPFLNPGQK